MKKNTRQILLRSLCLGTLLACSWQAVAVELYRWTDDKGVTHFSDKRPKGVDAEKVRYRAPKANANAAVEEPQTADPDAERCKTERERLSILQSNRRVQMEGRDGVLRELTKEEIEQEVAFSQRAIDRFCKPQNEEDPT